MSRALITPFLALGALGAAALAPILQGPSKPPAPQPAPTAHAPTLPATAVPAVTDGSGLSVAVQADRTRVMPGDPTVQLKLILTAPEAPTTDEIHTSTDLLLVLDRSGSMGGDKILDLKAAAHELVGQLGPDDRLAIVSFGSDVRLDRPLLPPEGSAHDVIESLTAGGGTPMSAALQHAQGVWSTPSAGRARRTVLISDGHPDDASPLVVQATTLARSEAPLTTVGIGMDYNEGLMQGLADAGTGNFHWVQRGPQLAMVLADELHTARQTAASAVSVQLSSEQGARIVSAAGYPVHDGILELGSLFAGQRRTLWLTVALPGGLRPGALAPGDVEIRYSELSGARHLASATVPPLEVTQDTERFFAGIDQQGWADAVVNEQYNELRSEVSQLLQEGRAEEALSSCADFSAQNGAVNRYVGSEVVADNLAEVERLKAEITTQMSNPHHLQNAWAKKTSQEAYRGRRSGQYLNPVAYE